MPVIQSVYVMHNEITFEFDKRYSSLKKTVWTLIINKKKSFPYRINKRAKGKILKID